MHHVKLVVALEEQKTPEQAVSDTLFATPGEMSVVDTLVESDASVVGTLFRVRESDVCAPQYAPHDVCRSHQIVMGSEPVILPDGFRPVGGDGAVAMQMENISVCDVEERVYPLNAVTRHIHVPRDSVLCNFIEVVV